MAPRILSGLFWLAGLLLVVYGLRSGGSALWIPGTVAAVLLLFLGDLLLHRRLVALDKDLLRTALHLGSAAALAAGSLYWATRLFPN